MSEERNQELHDIEAEFAALVRRLHDISERELRIGRRIDTLERAAVTLAAPEAEMSLRSAFIKLNAGESLVVAAHLDLSIPASTFSPIGGEAKAGLGTEGSPSAGEQ